MMWRFGVIVLGCCGGTGSGATDSNPGGTADALPPLPELDPSIAMVAVPTETSSSSTTGSITIDVTSPCNAGRFDCTFSAGELVGWWRLPN